MKQVEWMSISDNRFMKESAASKSALVHTRRRRFQTAAGMKEGLFFSATFWPFGATQRSEVEKKKSLVTDIFSKWVMGAIAESALATFSSVALPRRLVVATKLTPMVYNYLVSGGPFSFTAFPWQDLERRHNWMDQKKKREQESQQIARWSISSKNMEVFRKLKSSNFIFSFSAGFGWFNQSR